MSLSYAESLSPFPHKGKVGMPELTEKSDELQIKLEKLEELIRQSKHTVVITGAGISTDAGIPDFRGPNGVWTLEKRGEKPTFNTGFDQAVPTYTHYGLCTLAEHNYLHFVISQNIDGLHHRSGLPLDKLAELHGNVFSEECELCRTQIIRPTCVGSYCRKRTGNMCNSLKGREKNLRCRGKLRDTILDWEDPLPELALQLSEHHCGKADLCICLGTSLQISPCRDLPRKTKKNHGKIVIVNLQKTSMDSLADLIIHERCDRVMKYILEKLNLHFVQQYSHVKKLVLILGKSKSGKDFLAQQLQQQIKDLILLKLNTSSCEDLLKENDELCSKNSFWIIENIQSNEQIEFFKKNFQQRLLLVSICATDETREKRGWIQSNDQERTSFDDNLSYSFIFQNNENDNFQEQINDLIKMIQS